MPELRYKVGGEVRKRGGVMRIFGMSGDEWMKEVRSREKGD